MEFPELNLPQLPQLQFWYELEPKVRTRILVLSGISVGLGLGYIAYLLLFKRKKATGFAAGYFPPKPNFSPMSQAKAQSVFGTIGYKANPDGTFVVTNGWDSRNLVMVDVPQLKKLGLVKDGKIAFHRLAAKQLQEVWADWEKEGVLDDIISWDGAYHARFIRGSSSSISMHAYGAAFDLNALDNLLGRQPAPIGQKGTLLRLVEIAHQHGFYWGGHFNSRKDGMHFEVATIQ